MGHRDDLTEDAARALRCWAPPQQNCIASGCMAWVQSDFHDHRARELWSKSKGTRVTGAQGNDADWRLVDPNDPLPPVTGYCGAIK